MSYVLFGALTLLGLLDSLARAGTINLPATDGTICTIAGTGIRGYSGDGGSALSADLSGASDVSIDAQGQIYFAEPGNRYIRKIDTQGVLSTLAGNGEDGFLTDGTPATDNPIGAVATVAVNDSGDVYSVSASTIYKVDADGNIHTVFELGRHAANVFIVDMVIDSTGAFYLADFTNSRVYRVGPEGNFRVLAGTGARGYSGDGGPATQAMLAVPQQIALDGEGNVFVADDGNHTVRKISPAGIITTLAGDGTRGFSGDGGPAAQALLNGPGGLARAANGDLYVADSENHRIRKIDGDGIITTVVGSGERGFSGDDGPALAAALWTPGQLTIDRSGNLYFDDDNNVRLRAVRGLAVPAPATSVPAGTTPGHIYTVAGSGTFGFAGDGEAATLAQLTSPSGILVDGNGEIYIGDSFNNLVRKVDTTGTITTLAGARDPNALGDGGHAINARLVSPAALAVDAQGALYIATPLARRVRKIDPDGTISTLAGDGQLRYAGDGGDATLASLFDPNDVAVDAQGNVYIADTFNYRIRKVDPDGIITTIAGDGQPGFSGDGGPATSARLNAPNGLYVTAEGVVYIADTENNAIRKIDLDGTISTVAGNGERGYAGDGGPAPQALLNQPRGVVVDGAGNLYLADSSNHAVRKVDADGTMTTVAGSGPEGGNDGDGQPATDAILRFPLKLAIDGRGDLYVTDSGNQRVRVVRGIAAPVDHPAVRLAPFVPNAAPDPPVDTTNPIALADTVSIPTGPWLIRTIAGTGSLGTGDGGSAAIARLNSPDDVSVGPDGQIYIADTGNNSIRRIDAEGIITRIAGTGDFNFGGVEGFYDDATLIADGTPALDVRLNRPGAVAGDRTGTFYFTFGPKIYRVGGDGLLHTVVDLRDVVARSATDIAVAGDGQLYFADSFSHRVFKLDRQGSLSVFAGVGSFGFAGDGGPATAASLNAPKGVAVDHEGNVYIADTENHAIRRVTTDGTMVTIAGGSRGFAGEGEIAPGDGGPAVDAQFNSPSGIAVDGAGRVFIADGGNGRIRMVDRDGIISTVAGTGANNWPGAGEGEGVLATDFGLSSPNQLAINARGDLYISDAGSDRVFAVTGIAVPPPLAATTGPPSAALSDSLIRFDEGPADLYTPVGGISTRTLLLYNTGEGLLHIDSLGLDSPVLSLSSPLDGLADQRLAPGDSLLLTIHYRPAFATRDSALLRVESNDPQQPFLTARIEAAALGSNGDFDGDGRADLDDFALFADHFETANPSYDLNGDGRVSFSDFFLFADFFRAFALGE